MTADERRERFALLAEAIGEMTELHGDVRLGLEPDFDAMAEVARTILANYLDWSDYVACLTERGREPIDGGEAAYVDFKRVVDLLADPVAMAEKKAAG